MIWHFGSGRAATSFLRHPVISSHGGMVKEIDKGRHEPLEEGDVATGEKGLHASLRRHRA